MNSRRYVICDIEATGLDHDKDIIEIALITYQDGKVVDVYETLINPLKAVSEHVHKLTSISQRELQEAPKFYDVAEAIKVRLEDNTFVAHNVDFDLGLLKKKFAEMGQELKVKTFCTLKVSQHEIPGLKSYNLDAICGFFGIKISERHRAIGDARATLDLFLELFKLRLKTYPKVLYLPRHEKLFKNIPAKAGLLVFKNARGKVIRMEAVGNMEKMARALLEVKYENRDLLEKTESVEAEVTGSTLIAEFKRILYYPTPVNWMIAIQETPTGEKVFKLRPYKKGMKGLWFYKDYLEAKRKLRHLSMHLREEAFVYREGAKSKEEIIRQNQKVERLAKNARFPTDNLIVFGEGRSMGERSFILVKQGHVAGFGYTEATEEEVLVAPETYLTRRFFMHLGADLATQNYLRALKNMRQKTEAWRSLQSN